MAEDQIYFTIEEANALLPHLTGRLNTIQQQRDVIRELLEGGATETDKRIRERVDTINAELGAIHEMGCLVKDLDTGLVDFFAHGENGDIFLCWQLGEPEIRFWHLLDTGAAGRQPVSTLLGSSLRPLH